MRKVRISGGFVVLLAVFCFLSSIGGATSTCYVTLASNNSVPYLTINGAISAAILGDTLTVTGICTENVIVPIENLTLNGGGTATSAGASIQALDPTSPAVKIQAPNVTINGFSITGGSIGVHVSGLASAIIINNIIQSNAGAGILVRENSAAHIGFIHDNDTDASPNAIQNNGSDGVQVIRTSYVRLTGNTLSGNVGNGILVDRVSQADIAGNTIDQNSQNGIYVSGNSGVNLGAENSGTIFNLPNDTDPSAENSGYGIACASGGYAAGYQGALKGKKGLTSFAANCVNALTAPPPSSYPVLGTWTVNSCSNVTQCANTVTFESNGTGTIVIPGTPPTNMAMTWNLKGDLLSITTVHGISYGTITWADSSDVTYTFIEPGNPGTSIMTLSKQ